MGMLLGLTSTFILCLYHRQSEHQKISAVKRQLRSSNLRLLITANLLISGTCFVRLFYCFSGPLFSSTTHTMDFHLSLLDSTVVWEAVTSMIAIVVFRNWASFGMPQGERKLHTFLAVLAAVAIPLYLTFAMIYELGVTRAPFVTLVLRPALLEAISATVAIAYAYRVQQFVRFSLSSPSAAASRANRTHRKRIATFMIIASFANVLSVVSGILALLPPISVSVWWRLALYTMMFTGLTLQSITQGIAFFPSLSIVLDKAESSKLGSAKEIRDRLKCARDSLGTNWKDNTVADLSWMKDNNNLCENYTLGKPL
eukprot:c1912_g1_i1.p1 GENE.c1912_g1_i1~~c1912_g1_i1.p1  ORF type:complete len:313 (+),score=65.84 c1912_g1_i1:124-1062(+)